jgi:CheY-like chemotaxis protein
VLVIDDMENVAKRLRQLLPPHVTLVGFTSAQSALVSARERMCRVMLIDTEMPDVDGLARRTAARCSRTPRRGACSRRRTTSKAQGLGFSDALFWPFTPESTKTSRCMTGRFVREDNLFARRLHGGRMGLRHRLSTFFGGLSRSRRPASSAIDLSGGCAADRLPKPCSVVEGHRSG